jgi:hypothetical protein
MIPQQPLMIANVAHRQVLIPAEEIIFWKMRCGDPDLMSPFCDFQKGLFNFLWNHK